MNDDMVTEESHSDSGKSTSQTSTKKPACDYCKRRKIKCDYQHPCFQCYKRGMACEYSNTSAPNPKRGIVAKLYKKLDEANAELAVQKQLVEYWRSRYFEKENEHHARPSPKEEILTIWRRPSFSKATTDFCANVLQAVSLVTRAFTHIIKVMMPHSTPELGVECSAMIWNRLVDSVPDALRNSTKSLSPETISQMLIHCSVFATGSRLLPELKDNDLSQHFHAIAELLSSILISQIEQIHPDAAKQLLLSFIYLMLYHKINRTFSAIPTLWRKANSALLAVEKVLDPHSYSEIVVCLNLLETPENKTDAWFRKLDAINFSDKYEIYLLRKSAQSIAMIQRLDQIKADTQALTQLWGNVTEMAANLNHLHLSPYYQLFTVWVYGLKAIAAVNMPLDMTEEINRCTHIVAQLFPQLTNRAEQVWLSRDFEHLHHVLLTRQQQLEDNSDFDLTLEVLEALKMSTQLPLYEEVALPMNGSTSNQNNNFNTNVPFFMVPQSHASMVSPFINYSS